MITKQIEPLKPSKILEPPEPSKLNRCCVYYKKPDFHYYKNKFNLAFQQSHSVEEPDL